MRATKDTDVHWGSAERCWNRCPKVTPVTWQQQFREVKEKLGASEQGYAKSSQGRKDGLFLRNKHEILTECKQ